MSVSSILLFVGATTLVAALVTLCAFQMNVAKLERRINRRSRTLEGPEPGHPSLSSIGLSADAARRSRPSPGSLPLRATGPVAVRNDSGEEVGRSAATESSRQAPAEESRLNSLHTIQARSAALQGDDQSERTADSVSPMPARFRTAQPGLRREAPDQEPEQELDASQPNGSTESAGNVDSIMRSPGAPSVEPGVHHSSDQAPPDALADPGPEPAGDLLPDGIGGPPSQEDGLADMFTGADVADAGTLEPIDELSDIDGGGLPSTPRRVPRSQDVETVPSARNAKNVRRAPHRGIRV